MKVYLVLGYDRHSDIVSKVFSREEDAQKYFDNYDYETDEARNVWFVVILKIDRFIHS